MKEILDLFTSKDELRKSLLIPSIVGVDEVASTDGFGAVIIKDSELAKEYRAVTEFPNVFKIIPEENRNDVITIEQLETAFDNCLKVDEVITKDLGECPVCDGLGYCHHCQVECERCSGQGRLLSTEMTGKKVVWELDKFFINGINFMYPQMKRLYDSMKLLGINSIAHLSGYELKPNLMRHENYTFVIMPCRTI